MYKKIIMGLVCLILVISTYKIGTVAGEYLNKRKTLQQRSKFKSEVIKNLENIYIGSILPNYSFETLEFNTVMLKPLVKSSVILMFIEPDCHSCLENIERNNYYLSDSISSNSFVIVSSGNPRQLLDIQKSYNIISPILYDHNKGYSSIFQIDTYPLHILINKDMKVIDIIEGQLYKEDISKFL